MDLETQINFFNNSYILQTTSKLEKEQIFKYKSLG